MASITGARLFPFSEIVLSTSMVVSGDVYGEYVARVYANFASDIQNGTNLCATFEDAFIHHQLIDAFERTALNGKRVLINSRNT